MLTFSWQFMHSDSISSTTFSSSSPSGCATPLVPLVVVASCPAFWPIDSKKSVGVTFVTVPGASDEDIFGDLVISSFNSLFFLLFFGSNCILYVDFVEKNNKILYFVSGIRFLFDSKFWRGNLQFVAVARGYDMGHGLINKHPAEKLVVPRWLVQSLLERARTSHGSLCGSVHGSCRKHTTDQRTKVVFPFKIL